jgi:glycosyltransferase involved in cell wall biosynthesis
MKVLWVNTNFLHPTTKGGQIRTLEILRQLSRRHEIHYIAIQDPDEPDAWKQASEYSAKAYPFAHRIPSKRSLAFVGQLARGLFSPMPLAVSRFHSPRLGRFLAGLIERERFDRAVVDHLAPASYFPDMRRALFFQHNVETVIWRRHVEHAAGPVRRRYFQLQADRMFEFERRVSREAGHIVAVSDIDAEIMRKLFDVDRISVVPTGVNIEYFACPGEHAPVADLSFVGSMDWLPNVDGVKYFVREVLPLIRASKPGCTFAIAGRTPPPDILELARADPSVIVTGTVPDVRPYFWGAKVSVVPLRIGGGTRLKIYEAMAARVPVVSTSIGAEGLEVRHPENIRLADTPQAFARECVDLLEDSAERRRLAGAAWEMVSSRFSWPQVARCFERTLEQAPALQ